MNKEIIIKIKDIYIHVSKKMLMTINKECRINLLERMGYVFSERIIDTQEYIINQFTMPNYFDYGTEEFCRMSFFHKRKAKRILNKNTNLSVIGFWHTHPNNLSTQPSETDVKEQKRSSKKRYLSTYLIASDKNIRIIVYKENIKIFEREITENEWMTNSS